MPEYQRFGESQSGSTCRGNHVGLALSFLLIGLGAGAVAALLYAPSEGRKTRRMLRRRYEDALDAFAEWKDTAGDIIDKGGEWATSAADTAKEKVAPFRRAVRR